MKILLLLLSFSFFALGTACKHGDEETDSAQKFFGKKTEFSKAGVKILNLKAEDGLALPTLVMYPEASQAEALPLVVMTNGFLVNRKLYQTVLAQVALEGFVVVAPQGYDVSLPLPIGKPSTDVEARRVAEAVTWLETRLATLTAKEIDFTNVGLMAHSRGGKVAWTIVRDNLLPVKAIVAIDPVDGNVDGSKRVTGGEFKLNVPALVIGSGLGGNGLQACAPVKLNYSQFWNTVTDSPSYLQVAKDYGHMDFLEEKAGCGLICAVCASAGKKFPKEDFRNWVASSASLYLKAVLYGDKAALARFEDRASPIEVTKSNSYPSPANVSTP
ncbi:MAG: hypothetical protein H7318_08030 [Oligoflexus sp.]|nr:hypothetical protein [Oligoflexus sp.]